MSDFGEAYAKALQMRSKAYAPYSNFYVGAVVVTNKGQVYTGCNVENAVYGLTQCAERSAISQMISDAGKQVITDVIVASSSDKPCPPCGACRQVIAEFANSETRVHCITEQGDNALYLLKDLLPACFNLLELEA